MMSEEATVVEEGKTIEIGAVQEIEIGIAKGSEENGGATREVEAEALFGIVIGRGTERGEIVIVIGIATAKDTGTVNDGGTGPEVVITEDAENDQEVGLDDERLCIACPPT